MPAGAPGAVAAAPPTSAAATAAPPASAAPVAINNAAAYAQALAAAAESVPRPPVPAVLMVADRQVYVENTDVPPPGYVLVRRWMRNEPEVDVESIAGPTSSTMMLPQPSALAGEEVPEPPPLVDDPDDYEPEQAVCDLKRHWVRQRKYHTAKRMRRLQRYQERIKLLMSSNTMSLSQLLAQQQQQAQDGEQAQEGQAQQPNEAQQQQQQQQHDIQQQLQAQILQLQSLAQGHLLSPGAALQQQQQQQEHQERDNGGVLLQLPPHALTALLLQQQAQALEAHALGAQQQAAEAAAAAAAAAAAEAADQQHYHQQQQQQEEDEEEVQEEAGGDVDMAPADGGLDMAAAMAAAAAAAAAAGLTAPGFQGVDIQGLYAAAMQGPDGAAGGQQQGEGDE